MNEKITTIQNNLAKKMIDYVTVSQVLSSQGYFVNNTKKIKNSWNTMIYDIIGRINHVDKKIFDNIVNVYNNLAINNGRNC